MYSCSILSTFFCPRSPLQAYMILQNLTRVVPTILLRPCTTAPYLSCSNSIISTAYPHHSAIQFRSFCICTTSKQLPCLCIVVPAPSHHIWVAAPFHCCPISPYLGYYSIPPYLSCYCALAVSPFHHIWVTAQFHCALALLFHSRLAAPFIFASTFSKYLCCCSIPRCSCSVTPLYMLLVTF